MKKKKVVIGVFGSDCHEVGNKIIKNVLELSGFEVINVGVLSPQEDFVTAAKENKADAIIVSSIYSQNLSEYIGLREKCKAAKLKDILIYIGGNIARPNEKWETTQKKFLKMGFDRAYRPGTPIEETIEDLKHDLF